MIFNNKEQNHIVKPPLVLNYEGEIRRVGFELELTGLDIEDISKVINQVYGGQIQRHNDYIYEVKDTGLGSFFVELDFRLLRDMALRNYFHDLGINESEILISIENILASLSKTVVPYEVIYPPIPWDNINIADSLRKSLYEKKALGTRASIFYAFGLHMNIEVTSFDVKVILNYIRSFMLLYEWLKKKIDTDLTRKVTPFIDPFPQEYVSLALEANYLPSLENLIDDYIDFNPDRNRPLDLLPLFAFLDERRVKSQTSDSLIKPRPAFHYRLPNSKVDDPDWRIANEWNLWVEVEKLSVDDRKINLMTEEYKQIKNSLISDLISDWADRVEIWLS